MTEESCQLQGNDDAANATHKAGDYGIGYQSYVLAKTQQTKDDLHDARQDYGSEDERWVAIEGGEYACKDHNHRSCWTCNL